MSLWKQIKELLRRRKRRDYREEFWNKLDGGRQTGVKWKMTTPKKERHEGKNMKSIEVCNRYVCMCVCACACACVCASARAYVLLRCAIKHTGTISFVFYGSSHVNQFYQSLLFFIVFNQALITSASAKVMSN